ncbi:MAG: sigma factor-like helix-turn-helix DNA-binding protein [Bacteroidales bacterium]
MAQLPVNQREVFLMSKDENSTYSEIAEKETGITVKAVEKRMSAALAYLREALE